MKCKGPNTCVKRIFIITIFWIKPLITEWRSCWRSQQWPQILWSARQWAQAWWWNTNTNSNMNSNSNTNKNCFKVPRFSLFSDYGWYVPPSPMMMTTWLYGCEWWWRWHTWQWHVWCSREPGKQSVRSQCEQILSDST